MSSFYPGGPYHGELVTSSPITGGAADADSLPVATARRNGVTAGDFTIVVANAGTGDYTLAGTIPSDWAEGDVISIRVAATVGGVPGLGAVDSFILGGPGGNVTITDDGLDAALDAPNSIGGGTLREALRAMAAAMAGDVVYTSQSADQATTTIKDFMDSGTTRVTAVQTRTTRVVEVQ